MNRLLLALGVSVALHGAVFALYAMRARTATVAQGSATSDAAKKVLPVQVWQRRIQAAVESSGTLPARSRGSGAGPTAAHRAPDADAEAVSDIPVEARDSVPGVAHSRSATTQRADAASHRTATPMPDRATSHGAAAQPPGGAGDPAFGAPPHAAASSAPGPDQPPQPDESAATVSGGATSARAPSEGDAAQDRAADRPAASTHQLRPGVHDGTPSAPALVGAGGNASLDIRALHQKLAASALRCAPAPLRRARQRRTAAVATVRFCADEAGRVADVTLISPSGDDALDEAARRCVVQGALPLPVDRGCYDVPIQFGE